jgi:SAM-dependent methyltransferase
MSLTISPLAPAPSPVAAEYDALAPAYDALTSAHRYEEWTRDLEALARRHGLRGRRLLDVACGTGKSFVPFLARGYRVAACDISAGMVAAAREKPETAGVDLRVADMRDLRAFDPPFDLVTCLDDAVNYLVTPRDLRAAFSEVRRLLARDGVYVFDVNSLLTYRTVFAGDCVVDTPTAFLAICGRGSPDTPPGSECTAVIHGFLRDARRGWTRIASRQTQRHHPAASLPRLLERCGLECAGIYGQCADGTIAPSFHELSHTKAIVVARPASHDPERGGETP